jgi:hypothetical protein
MVERNRLMKTIYAVTNGKGSSAKVLFSEVTQMYIVKYRECGSTIFTHNFYDLEHAKSESYYWCHPNAV